jgi:hypothetical protein
MPNLIFLQLPPWIVPYVRGLMARVVATVAFAWARGIFIEGGTDVLDRALAFAREWASRCVLIFSQFAIADVY